MEILSLKKVVLMMIMMMCIIMAKSEIHYVGGNKSSWKPGVNFTNWSRHENFHLKDWLYFGYDRYKYSVLEVNKTSYENCIEEGFIKNISRGAGTDVYRLKKHKTYYFLSGHGYCKQGLKVAINVPKSVVPPTLTPAPKSVAAPTLAPSPKIGAPAPSPHSASDAILINKILLVFIFVFFSSFTANNISY